MQRRNLPLRCCKTFWKNGSMLKKDRLARVPVKDLKVRVDILRKEIAEILEEIERRKRTSPPCPCRVLTLTGVRPCEIGQDCPSGPPRI